MDGRAGSAERKGWSPVIWLILIIGAVVVIASVALFADREEAAVIQAAMVAEVAIIVVSGLVLVRFLDKPYVDKSGSIRRRWRGRWRRWRGLERPLLWPAQATARKGVPPR